MVPRLREHRRANIPQSAQLFTMAYRRKTFKRRFGRKRRARKVLKRTFKRRASRRIKMRKRVSAKNPSALMRRRLSRKNQRKGDYIKRWYKIKDTSLEWKTDTYVYTNPTDKVKIGDFYTNFHDLSDMQYGRITDVMIKFYVRDKVFNTSLYELSHPYMIEGENNYFDMELKTLTGGTQKLYNPFFSNDANLSTAQATQVQTNIDKAFMDNKYIPFSKKVKLRKNMKFRCKPKIVHKHTFLTADTAAETGYVNVETERRFFRISDGIEYDITKYFLLPKLHPTFTGRPATGATEWGYNTELINIHYEVWCKVEAYKKTAMLNSLTKWTALANLRSGLRSTEKDDENEIVSVADQIRSVKKELQDQLEPIRQGVVNEISGSHPVMAAAASILGLNAKRPRYDELKH